MCESMFIPLNPEWKMYCLQVNQGKQGNRARERDTLGL